MLKNIEESDGRRGVEEVFCTLFSLNICCIGTSGCGVLHTISRVVLSALVCLWFFLSNKTEDLM